MEMMWFGLKWPTPVEISRVRAHLEFPGEVALDVVGLDDQPTEVALATPIDGILEFSIDPTRVVAIRLRPVDWLDAEAEPFGQRNG